MPRQKHFGWRSGAAVFSLLILAACGKSPSANDVADAVGRQVDNVSCRSVSDNGGGYICSYRPVGTLMNTASRLKKVEGRWRVVR